MTQGSLQNNVVSCEVLQYVLYTHTILYKHYTLDSNEFEEITTLKCMKDQKTQLKFQIWGPIFVQNKYKMFLMDFLCMTYCH